MSPRTWTYCSKRCEITRLGPGEAELSDEDLESILDDQVSREGAPKSDRRLLKARMRRTVESAYRDALEAKKQHRRAPPKVDQLDRSSNEFWMHVLGDHHSRYKDATKNYGFYFIKFCRAATEAYMFDAIEVSDVIDLPGPMQRVVDVTESGAMESHCKKLPRSDLAILEMTKMCDDDIDAAITKGFIQPRSSIRQVRQAVEYFNNGQKEFPSW